MSLSQPVRYPVKHYSYLDPGAPQLADVDGAIKAILKACLVTGIGSKVGAGWASMFEDSFRIILRRPLRSGNPPDIKIENGIINGSARHRIVSQDNPTSLSDIAELSSVNLLARDNKFQPEWHLIASDFGFMFLYQMGEDGRSGSRNHALYLGSTSKINESELDYFVVTKQGNVDISGKTGVNSKIWLAGLVGNETAYLDDTDFYDIRRNERCSGQLFLDSNVSEKYYNNNYFAQKIIVANKFVPPFFCSVTTDTSNVTSSSIYIESRPMLRWSNVTGRNYRARVLYTPLDYWEL